MYTDENDYELLYLISESNEDAKDIVFEKYKSDINALAVKYYPLIKNKGYELNDLVQEGMLGLNEAINSFSEQKNVQFNTFANICMTRQIKSFIRNINRQKHIPLNESISIDTTTDSIGRKLIDKLPSNTSENPESSFIDEEEENKIIDKIKVQLTSKEKEVFELRLQGFSYQEIAALLGKSIKSIDGTISRIKNKYNKNKINIRKNLSITFENVSKKSD